MHPPRKSAPGLEHEMLINFGYFYRGQFIEESDDKITVSVLERGLQLENSKNPMYALHLMTVRNHSFSLKPYLVGNI